MIAGWNDLQLSSIASQLQGIAQPTRLGILCLLGDGELSVGEIYQMLGTTQPNISQHLAILSNKKLVRSRKEKNRIFYSIGDKDLLEVIRMLRKIYCPDEEPAPSQGA